MLRTAASTAAPLSFSKTDPETGCWRKPALATRNSQPATACPDRDEPNAKSHDHPGVIDVMEGRDVVDDFRGACSGPESNSLRITPRVPL
jgi:hypothetical protein